MIILGVDPGSTVTGFGLIDQQGSKLQLIQGGCIRPPRGDVPTRLEAIYRSLVELIQSHRPDHAAIETCFMARNPNTAIKLGQARGMALLAAQQHGCEIHEYAPRQAKQTVAGYGHADKAQIQQMVKNILKLDRIPSNDAADALALAICHAHHWPLTQR